MFYRLSWLPVWEDSDEAPHVYGYLCQLIENNHPIVLGPNNSNIPRLIAIMAEAFLRDAIPAEHEVKQRMLHIIRQIQVSVICKTMNHLKMQGHLQAINLKSNINYHLDSVGLVLVCHIIMFKLLKHIRQIILFNKVKCLLLVSFLKY